MGFQVILSSLCGYNAAARLNFVKSPHSFIYMLTASTYSVIVHSCNVHSCNFSHPTAVQTPVNCHYQLEKHPVEDVEPVKIVVQYLTQAAVKLPSAGDDMRSSVQHANLSITVLGALALSRFWLTYMMANVITNFAQFLFGWTTSHQTKGKAAPPVN